MSDEIPIRRRVRRSMQPQSLRGPQKQVKQADAQERRRQALDLRRGGMTYDQIARRMNLSTAMVAWRYVNDAIAQIPREEALATKAVELNKLDALELRLEKRLTDQPGDMKAYGMKLRCMERRARYLGLDAPVRTELTGRDGGVIRMSVDDLKGMTDDQLDKLTTAALRDATSSGSGGADSGEASSETGRARRTH